MGLFYEFVNDASVRMIGVEAAGEGVTSSKTRRHTHPGQSGRVTWGHELSLAG